MLRPTALLLRQVRCRSLVGANRVGGLTTIQRATKTTSSNSDPPPPETEKESLSMMQLAKKYGKIGLIVMTVEYVIAWILLYFACDMANLPKFVDNWMGPGSVQSAIDTLAKTPFVGEYVQSFSPNSIANFCVAGLVNEASWIFRLPLLLFVIKRIGSA
eukprot:TRINITY_DN17472_c0_g1_i1.p1 TRINITY_DN17472_c0_g1~~TRINITY_DN17472_c0_g1_i1.p1  ORF type:complete len:172 (+),score=14.61 TRINITY_DN17472_c0_g1_i1:42-518(+)